MPLVMTRPFPPAGPIPLVFTEKQKIQAGDKALNDQFGRSVAISSDGESTIVGANLEDGGGTDSGAAYFFSEESGSPVGWIQKTKVPGQVGSAFGNAVSISNDGNTAVVGAEFNDNPVTENGGSAHIYTKNSGSPVTWSLLQKITPAGLQAFDNFGKSVAISGDGNTIIVGADDEQDIGDKGYASIWVKNGSTWSEQQKIQASDGAARDRFGFSVSLSDDGNTAIIGAHQEDIPGTDSGAAYIFTRSGSPGVWTELQKIESSDIEDGDNFGNAVSMSGDGTTAIVGAWLEHGSLSDAGAAYIFTKGSGSPVWSEQEKLTASDATNLDYFGTSVSISGNGNAVAVGAYIAGTGGAVYVFSRSGGSWTEDGILTASDTESGDRFGYSVSISSDATTIISGAYAEDTGGGNAGAAYIFRI